MNAELLTIGQVAERSGLAVSAVRFYADEGLIHAVRTPAGHRRFRRSSIRRLAFIQTSQRLGYPLADIARHLATLPADRAPTEKQWERMATSFARDLDDRIDALVRLRSSLEGCIGCGCLSLSKCAIWNANDHAASRGTGPRWLIEGGAPDPNDN